MDGEDVVQEALIEAYRKLDRPCKMPPMAFLDPSAFIGTNPTDELITSRLPVTRERRPGMSPNPRMLAKDCSEEELRSICDGLFIPQRHHGIDAHGAARGDVAGCA